MGEERGEEVGPGLVTDTDGQDHLITDHTDTPERVPVRETTQVRDLLTIEMRDRVREDLETMRDQSLLRLKWDPEISMSCLLAVSTTLCHTLMLASSMNPLAK